jgi:hypothetical protein
VIPLADIHENGVPAGFGTPFFVAYLVCFVPLLYHLCPILEIINLFILIPEPASKSLQAGYVEVHITHHTKETAQNVETAIFLAKLVFKIRLLGIDNTPGVKNPDAYFVDERIIVEFKHNQTPTPSAIENALKDAKRQADHVLLHIQSDLTKGDLIHGLRRHIHRAPNVKSVWIIYQNKLYQFSREEIRNQTIAYKIQ